MNKKYIVISLRHIDGKNPQPAGVFGYDGYEYYTTRSTDSVPFLPCSRLADMPEEEQRAIIASLYKVFGITPTEKFVHQTNEVRVFNRKNARALAAALNCNTLYMWRVIEVGAPAERDMRPVLRWKIMLPSYHRAAEPTESSHTISRLYTSRKEVRELLAKLKAARSEIYKDATIEPVYGAWRADYYVGNTLCWGGLRFRTKRDAKEYIDTVADSGRHKINRHNEEVPETHLYVP